MRSVEKRTEERDFAVESRRSTHTALKKVMPAYHSKLVGTEFTEACGCALLPLKTKTRGPAPACTEEEDIVDEVIKFFRPNSLFRNFDVKGGADRTLIYLTLSMQQVIKECERFKTRPEAEKAVQAMTMKQFPIPGGPGTFMFHVFFLRVF